MGCSDGIQQLGFTSRLYPPPVSGGPFAVIRAAGSPPFVVRNAGRYVAFLFTQEELTTVTQVVDNAAAEDAVATVGTTPDSADRAPAGVGEATTMEDALAGTERSVEIAIKAATSTASALKRALAGARTGQVRDLRKALAAAAQAAAALAALADQAADGFTFDEQAYLASGGFVKELLAAGQERGVAMFEEDDLLLCYPSLLRVVPADAAVEIDRARERRLRPSVLIDQLARNQDRAPRFKAEAFLDSLRNAYELIAGRDGKKVDGIIRLVEIWGVLTILPGQGGRYSKQEFARDLYLLDQSGVTSTPRSPRRLRWSASTGTKGAGVLVVSRSGQQQRYWRNDRPHRT
jgi:hypothetical protein